MSDEKPDHPTRHNGQPCWLGCAISAIFLGGFITVACLLVSTILERVP